jgi:high-affinity nickel permease
MMLSGTLDGVFMTFAYGWTFARPAAGTSLRPAAGKP